MATRINARLDDALAAKVEEIHRRTGMTITEIVEAALEAWTVEVSRTRPGPASAFEAAGFVASARGPRTLSRTYKAELTRSLGKKA
jgi:predicted transcriptional regulator